MRYDGRVDVTCKFEILAKPRAKQSKIVAVRPGTIEIALAAPPVDGAANDELVRFLAASLRVAKRDVTLLRGAGGRHKLVEIHGLSTGDVVRLLGPAE